LNDLRRGGTAGAAMVQALEEWAATIRVLRPTDGELHVVQDGERLRVFTVSLPSTVEVLWPRRKLVARLADVDGTLRLSFDPPWTRTSSLPPIHGDTTALSFGREAEMGRNTFLLPLGHGAANFRRD